MGSIRVRTGSNSLFIDFRYMGQRCREQTALPDTPANRKMLEKLLKTIEAEILLGTFTYSNYFPNSKLAEKFATEQTKLLAGNRAGKLPTFAEFANIWLDEMMVTWRLSYSQTIKLLVKNRLIPFFGEFEVDRITKADILQFRAQLGKVRRENGDQLSPGHINRHLKVIQMILSEAADRYQFTAPIRLKPLKMQKSDVDPFTLSEVHQLIQTVDAEYRDYYIIRFFTGMRTAEVDGLQWRYVNFDEKLILIRETVVAFRVEETKTAGSVREIDISNLVMDALKRQFQKTGHKKFVFATRNDTAPNHGNITKRVWYPLLKTCGFRQRRPYQTRHTAATLWLAAGENPEWIARQMGHTSTEMLFRVYSRFVPNLTRRDGSAFEALLSQSKFQEKKNDSN